MTDIRREDLRKMTDIRREIARKAAEKQVDSLVREIIRVPESTPFETQVVDRAYRQFRHLLDAARFRGDDPARVAAAINAMAADMIMDYIMMSIRPHEGATIERVAQGFINQLSESLTQLINAYTQAPPASGAAASH